MERKRVVRSYRPKLSGVYLIVNLLDGRKYVGESTNIGSRWTTHLVMSTLPIQKDIREYGPSNFSFQVLEVVPKEKLKERERYWIEYYNAEYNKKK